MLLKEFLPSRVNFNTTKSPSGFLHLYISDYLPTPIFPMTDLMSPLLMKVLRAK